MLTTMDDLREYLNRGTIHSSDILSIMTTLRVQLEKDDLKKNYKWLNLFSNWCVHNELSRTKLSIDIFKTFYSVLGKYDLPDMKGFYDHIFDKLREEIKKIFLAYSIPTNLCDNENEEAFAGFIIGILLIIKDRPIYLPKQLSEAEQVAVDRLPELLKFRKKRSDIDCRPISLSIAHTGGGHFNCSLVMVGQTGGRLTFSLSPVSYKNKQLKYLTSS